MDSAEVASEEVAEGPVVVEAFAEKYSRNPTIVSAWRESAPVFVQVDLGQH